MRSQPNCFEVVDVVVVDIVDDIVVVVVVNIVVVALVVVTDHIIFSFGQQKMPALHISVISSRIIGHHPTQAISQTLSRL